MISGSITIGRLLGSMRALGASDLHIKVGIAPTYRVDGVLRAVDAEPLTEEEADHLLDPIVPAAVRERFERDGSVDFATHQPDGDRFRVSMFRAGAHTHAAIRRVKAEIPGFGELHLPGVYRDLADRTHEGLVIVCGVTGCGKSTTLASMIDHVSSRRGVNIITIEDPIEYRFTPRKAIVSQREIGIDVPDFPTAMRSVVRQDPDVIFIGEMRDHETILAGLQAAETGHLVFATLHTADVAQAPSRILEFFPQSERAFVRASLASGLRAVCAQRLIPAGESFAARVVPATEVLISTPSVRDLLREGADEDLPQILAQGSAEGMHTFTQSLAELVRQERLDVQRAMDHAPNREALDGMLRGVSVKAQGIIGRARGHA